MNYIEDTHVQNLKKNALTKKLIESGANDFEFQIAESIHVLVNQVALYRGVNRASAKKIVNQLLKEVKTK